jgi:hypothetical protein
MNKVAFLDELVKLGVISDEQARASLDRLESLEKNKPTGGQVARYGVLGAGAGAVGKAVSHSIEHGRLPVGRSLGGAAAAGAIGMGAMPLFRSSLDQRAEMGRLKKYMGQVHEGQYDKNQGAMTDAPTPSGFSR